MKGEKKLVLNSLMILFILTITICSTVQAGEWKLLFQPPQGMPAGWINQLIVHPTKSNVLFAGTEGAGIIVSEDGGKTWAQKNQGFGTVEEGTVSGFQIRCIAIDPTKPDTIYAGMAAFGVYKTTDAGNKWDTVSEDTLEDTFTKALAIHLSNPNIIYLGNDNNGGIHRYNNQTNKWQAISAEELPNQTINAIVMDPKDPKIIYVATNGFVGKTINGGDNWKVLSNGLTNRYILCLAMDSKDSKVLYAGTDGGGLFKTADGGEKWEAIGGNIWMTKPAAEDLAAPGAADVESTLVVSSVVVNPANSSIVYAANPSGVFRSADAGQTWAQINTGLTSTVIKNLAVNNTKPVIVYASTSDGKFFAYTEE
jgi:photosystem II stability/assembly factor-like uncharacterized protein